MIYMCRFVCLGMPKCVGGITWPKNAHAQFWVGKNDLRHLCYSFLLYRNARASFSMDEIEAEKNNVHLDVRNSKQRELQRLKNRGKKG